MCIRDRYSEEGLNLSSVSFNPDMSHPWTATTRSWETGEYHESGVFAGLAKSYTEFVTSSVAPGRVVKRAVSGIEYDERRRLKKSVTVETDFDVPLPLRKFPPGDNTTGFIEQATRTITMDASIDGVSGYDTNDRLTRLTRTSTDRDIIRCV